MSEKDFEPNIDSKNQSVESDNISSEERAKLTKEAKEYGALWPAFMAIGVIFFMLGIQQIAYLGVGISFLVLAVVWSSLATKANDKLKKHPEAEPPSPHV